MDGADLDALRSQLAGEEGDKPFLYDDATGKRVQKGSVLVGNPTIAIGYNLGARPLSPAVRRLMVDESIRECLDDLATFSWFQALDRVRQRAVVDFRFNVGAGTFRTFVHFIAAMERKDYQEAAFQLETAPWDHEVQPERAATICRQLRTGMDA